MSDAVILTPLEQLHAGDFVSDADVVLAQRVSRVLSQDVTGWPSAVLALCLRAVREGSTALDPAELASWVSLQALDPEDVSDATTSGESPDSARPTLGASLQLPDVQALTETVHASPLCAAGALHLDGGLIYLDRYYQDELLIAQRLTETEHAHLAPIDMDRAHAALGDAEAGRGEDVSQPLRLDETQQQAVESVMQHGVTVLTGGPGMGKTHTVSGVLLAVRAGLGHQGRIALAAPTGKAAARMTQALQENGVRGDIDAVTVHRLLGFRPENHTRFRHHRANPMPFDVVIVDEASMLPLHLLARLVEALKPSARLLLVGDPEQLASVEAGSVLADLITGLDPSQVVQLNRDYRLAGPRVTLAAAFRAGDPEAVLAALRDPAQTGPEAGSTPGDTGQVRFIDTDTVELEMLEGIVDWAARLHTAAVTGDAEHALAVLEQARLLCAHRTGPFGVRRWNRLIEGALFERYEHLAHQPMYPGRPLLITSNDRSLGLFNGDAGVIVAGPHGPRAVISTADGPREFSPWRLADVDTMHAMTVHKAQGSQSQSVTVILPPPTSPLLTREMLYTAVTRSQRDLTVIGSAASVTLAVRSPVRRVSGLAKRLRDAR